MMTLLMTLKSTCKPFEAAGCSSWQRSITEVGEKKQKGKLAKKTRTEENPQRNIPKKFPQDFGSGEIPHHKPLHKESPFETIYCAPAVIKQENIQDDEMNHCGYDEAIETDTSATAFVEAVIKPETQEDNDEVTALDMYQHVDLNCGVKGRALTSIPKIKSATSSSTMAISDGSCLTFPTSSLPRFSSVLIPPNQLVPSSSSGPVIVTTTYSYSSLTTTSSPLTASLSSSVCSVSCSTDISTASASVAVPMGLSLFPSEFTVLSPSTLDNSASLTAKQNNLTLHSSKPQRSETVPNSKDPPKLAPISDFYLTDPNNFTLQAPNQSHPHHTEHLQQPQYSQTLESHENLATTSKVQPLQIFQSLESTTEDLPASASDESDVFSISLTQFPQNWRVSIKHKMLDVVNCIKKKNISPDKVLIAFYGSSSDSRTM